MIMPYMPRFVVWLVILCVILLILAHFAHSAEDEAWDTLLRNDPVNAEKMFVQELSLNGSDLDALEGRHQALLMQGDIAGAYQVLKQEVETLTGNPLQGLFILRLSIAADFAGKTAEYNRFVKELFKNKDMDGYTRTVAAQVLNNICLYENNFSEAAAALDASTRISQVSRIVGPVYIPQKYGISLKTPVENNLLAPDYQSWENVEVNPGGRLEIGSVLPVDGRAGVAYIYVTLDSVSEGKGVLDLFCGSVCKVWLNGEPVYSPSLFRDGFTGIRNSRVLQLKKGKNLLLVKAYRNDNLQIGMRDIETGGKLEGVRVLPYDANDWKGQELLAYCGRLFSEEYISPAEKELERQNGMSSVFWRNFYYEYTNNYGKGIDMNNDLLRKYPESALINYMVGEYYQGYANYFESKQRTVSMCEKYMREALKLYPDYLLPEIVLARIYLASQQDTSALNMLKKIESGNKNIPWVYRTLAEQYLKQGWLALAMEAIEKYYSLDPHNAAGVISFYLDMNEFSKAERVYNTLVDQVLPLYGKYQLLFRMNKIAEAEKVIEEWHKHYPQSVDKYLAALCDIAQYRGDYGKLDECLQQRLQNNPHSVSLMIATGENKIRMGAWAEGIDWLRKAHKASLEYMPSVPELLKRIEVDSAGEFVLGDYDVDLDAVEYAKVEKQNYPRASYANLLNVRVVRVFEDLSAEVYEHRAFKVFGNEGITQLAELDTGPGEIIECRTISPDGAEYIPESSENVSFDKAISMYNVGINSVLEYSKRISSQAVPLFQDRFDFESFNNPVIRSRYVLIMPKTLLGRFSVEGYDPEVKLQGDDVALIWDGGEYNGQEPEDFMPLIEDVLENVSVSVYSEELSAPGLIAQDKPVLSTRELDETAMDLCRDLHTTREKVGAIYGWIVQNIQKNTDSLSARDAFSMRAGTPESRLKLMQAMLEAVGVTSYPLLSNIPFSVAGRLSRKDRVESISEFTLPMLLRVENEDSEQPDIWVRIIEDMKDSRIEDIGTLNQGALALEYSPYGARFSAVRDNTLEGVRVISPEIELLADGSAQVKGGVEFFGATATSPRKVLYNSIHAQQYAAQIANQLFPGITGASYEYPSVAELEQGVKKGYQPLIIRCSGTVLDYCSKRGEDRYFAPFREGDFVKNLIVKQPRIKPVLIQMDVQNSQSRRYTLPEGYVYMNVPMDRVINSSFGVFILDYNIDGRSLVVSGSLLIPAQEIEPEDSELYNSFLTEIKEAVSRGIIIRKIPGEFGVEVLDEGVAAPVAEGRFIVKHVPESVIKACETEGSE